ncbi:MAG: ECF transporter S component [Clostridia bacterium]|nr:ECF transporter S component [Clostridia bacterium]
MTKSKFSARTIAGVAMLSALVIVLQLFLGSGIKFGQFSITLVLIPIVVGAAAYGWLAGGFLGLVFGVTVLLSGDAALFLGYSAIGTIVTVILKGVLAGLVSGLVYKLTFVFNDVVRVLLAAIVCPIVNTGVFLIGCEVFFMKNIAADFDVHSFWGLIIAMVGINFFFELGINIILAPVVVRILKATKLAKA